MPALARVPALHSQRCHLLSHAVHCRALRRRRQRHAVRAAKVARPGERRRALLPPLLRRRGITQLAAQQLVGLLAVLVGGASRAPCRQRRRRSTRGGCWEPRAQRQVQLCSATASTGHGAAVAAKWGALLIGLPRHCRGSNVHPASCAGSSTAQPPPASAFACCAQATQCHASQAIPLLAGQR